MWVASQIVGSVGLAVTNGQANRRAKYINRNKKTLEFNEYEIYYVVHTLLYTGQFTSDFLSI